jgi:hypothetical protein
MSHFFMLAATVCVVSAARKFVDSDEVVLDLPGDIREEGVCLF